MQETVGKTFAHLCGNVCDEPDSLVKNTCLRCIRTEEAHLHHTAQGSSWHVAVVGPEPIYFSLRT